MEGIGIHHDEFLDPHQPEARADLVTELGMLLKEAHRQLLVAGDDVARIVGDDLFGGRCQTENLARTISYGEHSPGCLIGCPASGFLPQTLLLHDRHGDVQTTGAADLLGHDASDLVDDALQ